MRSLLASSSMEETVMVTTENGQVPLAEPLAETSKVPSGGGGSPTVEAPDEWEIKPEELKLGPRIGFGSFGEVHRGSWRYTDVAVKKLIDQELSPSLLAVGPLCSPKL